MQLSNTSIAQLFTISQQAWQALNTYVGCVNYINIRANSNNGGFYTAWPDAATSAYLNGISGSSPVYTPDKLILGVQAQNVTNGVVVGQMDWVIIPDIPNLWANCNNWMTHTFNMLIILNNNIQSYAGQAAVSFGNLNNAISGITGTVPAAIQTQTTAALNQLNTNTQSFISQSSAIFTQLQGFLNTGQSFQSYLNANPILANILNLPPLQAAGFADFINATEQLMGAWSAIQSELNAALSVPLNVTLPFLESLNLQAAISDWATVQSSCQNFMAFANQQNKYWFYQP